MPEIHIITSPVGVFGVNARGEIEERSFFPRDLEVAAEALRSLQRGEMIPQVEEIVLNLKTKGFDTFLFEDRRLSEKVASRFDVRVGEIKGDVLVSEFRDSLPETSLDLGFVESIVDFRDWVRGVETSIVRTRLREASGRRDLQIVQGVLTMDDLDKNLNLFANRVREWYGLHFPELGDLVDRHETYLRLLVKFKHRSMFTPSSLEEFGFSEERALSIAAVAGNSVGAEVSEEDLAHIGSVAGITLNMYEIRDQLESYLDDLMRECAPNITSLVGSSVGARLLALAGGLEKLAKMPSSTIQVLGAETALFRSLKTGSPPPKHGVIFQSPLIHQAKRRRRGKIARALAGKLAIAARIDAFSDRDEGEFLRDKLEKRVEEIKGKSGSSYR